MYGLSLFKGLGVTMKNLVSPGRNFTVHQYPDRKIGLVGLARMNNQNPVVFALRRPGESLKALMGLTSVRDRQYQHPRFRGEEFSWYENRCTGCASCAKYCPLGIIRIVTDPAKTDMQEGDKYFLEVFDIDIGRCMFCGLCVEACPYDAIHMGSGFEEGRYSRRDLVIDKARLVASPKRPSHWFRPQLEGRGRVASPAAFSGCETSDYNPLEGDEADWREVHRHERPSLTEQQKRWGQR